MRSIADAKNLFDKPITLGVLSDGRILPPIHQARERLVHFASFSFEARVALRSYEIWQIG